MVLCLLWLLQGFDEYMNLVLEEAEEVSGARLQFRDNRTTSSACASCPRWHAPQFPCVCRLPLLTAYRDLAALPCSQA